MGGVQERARIDGRRIDEYYWSKLPGLAGVVEAEGAGVLAGALANMTQLTTLSLVSVKAWRSESSGRETGPGSERESQTDDTGKALGVGGKSRGGREGDGEKRKEG